MVIKCSDQQQVTDDQAKNEASAMPVHRHCHLKKCAFVEKCEREQFPRLPTKICEERRKTGYVQHGVKTRGHASKPRVDFGAHREEGLGVCRFAAIPHL